MQPAALKAASRQSHELRLGGCVQPLGSGTVSTLPDTLQRGQHAAAGLGTGPHDPSGGQHDAVRCWLGFSSNDPLRCGLNSAHPTFAMRNLLQFAKSLRGCTMLPCFCIARTFYPADSMPPAFLWPGATVGWVGAPKFFAGFHFREAAFAASCAQGCLTVVA